MCVSCNNCKKYKTWYGEYRYKDKVPVMHMWFYDELLKKNMMSMVYDDPILLKYIKNNKEYFYDSFCYENIARIIMNKFLETRSETDVIIRVNSWNFYKFIVDHLFWAFGNPEDKDNKLKVFYEKLIRKKLNEKYKERTVRVRVGQKEYRDDLLRIHNKCQLCFIENSELLIASHIKDYSKSKSDECINFENGLLLCRNHDGLFDRGLISFTDEGSIIISNFLSESDIDKLDIVDKKIELSKMQKRYMKWHRENKFKQ